MMRGKKKKPSSHTFWDGGLRVATQLAEKDLDRSKYDKGYEPFDSSPKCLEVEVIAAAIGFPPSPILYARSAIPFFLKRINWIADIIQQFEQKSKLKTKLESEKTKNRKINNLKEIHFNVCRV